MYWRWELSDWQNIKKNMLVYLEPMYKDQQKLGSQSELSKPQYSWFCAGGLGIC